ncbi:MAG: hypothetical protein Kow00121_40770 [Elainellaceae cyanobacterium]
MTATEECYRVLDLQSGASIGELKESYRDLVTVWHPDRFVNNPRLHKKAENKLKSINVSYEYLLDILTGNESGNFLQLAQIIVIPQEVELEVGESRTFSAIGIDSNGTPCGIEVEWSADGGIIDSEGTFRAYRSGYFVVTAKVGDISGSAGVEVNQPEPTISPEPEVWNKQAKDAFGGLSEEEISELLDEPKRRIPWVRLLIWGFLAVMCLTGDSSGSTSAIGAFGGLCGLAWIAGLIRPGLVLRFGLPANRWVVTLIYLPLSLICTAISPT